MPTVALGLYAALCFACSIHDTQLKLEGRALTALDPIQAERMRTVSVILETHGVGQAMTHSMHWVLKWAIMQLKQANGRLAQRSTLI
jgi:hypothetical protein